MLETVFSKDIFTRLVNAALALDPAAQEKLSALNGRRISILLEPRAQAWIFAIEDGKIILPEDEDNIDAPPCDVRLSGTLTGLLQLFQNKQNPSGSGRAKFDHSAPRGKLYIEGDLYAAQQFQRVMGELKPDFDDILKRRFGEKLGTRLVEEARRLQSHGEALKTEAEQRIKDFLADCAASRDDNNAFAARMRQLNDRLQAAEKRLAALEQK